MGFFSKKPNKRDIYKEKFAEDTTKAYEREFKKKLVSDAKAKAKKDSMTRGERFKAGFEKVKQGRDKLRSFQGRSFEPKSNFKP